MEMPTEMSADRHLSHVLPWTTALLHPQNPMVEVSWHDVRKATVGVVMETEYLSVLGIHGQSWSASVPLQVPQHLGPNNCQYGFETNFSYMIRYLICEEYETIYITLHYITLHYITLHYITLHYMT